MFEQQFYRCPGCGTKARYAVEDGQDISCLSCGRRFRVMLDKDTGKVALVEITGEETPEPLFLPRGSIRALVTILTALSSWILMLAGRDVPGYVLSLLLATISYYFAFRKQAGAAQTRILDSSGTLQEPLFLPSGLIRFALVVGFGVCAVALYRSNRLGEPPYLEFYAILLGLVAGYAFSKVLSTLEGSRLSLALNHAKGVAVLAASICLCWVLLAGSQTDTAYGPLLLSCFISFYFGSRS